MMPRRVKHRKQQRGKHPASRAAQKGTTVAFGSFGLKASEGGIISARQIESARRAMTRAIARGGKIWIRVFPDFPVTQKGAQTPMGKGKGSVDHYAAKVPAGRVLFEIDGVAPEAAARAMALAAYKLSIKTKFVAKQ